jgi:hypothetical protein
VKKRNLKEIFLGLFVGARRRAGDKPPGDSFEASSARAEAISETGGRLSQMPPGPPADWLAKRSGGPPAHWVERVRQAAPELLQEQEKEKAVVTAPLQQPKQLQRKPAIPAPMRLERSTPTRSLRQDQPGCGADFPASSDRSVAEFQSERTTRSFSFAAPRELISVNSRRRGADAEEKLSKIECSQLPEMASAFGARGPAAASVVRCDTVAEAGNQPAASFVPEIHIGGDDYQNGAKLPRSKGSADPIYAGAPEPGIAIEIDPRENVEAPQFQIGDLADYRDQPQVRKEPDIWRLKSPEPASVKPVKVTRRETPSWKRAQAKVTSRRYNDAGSSSSMPDARRATRYPDVTHREVRRMPVSHELFVFDSGCRKTEKREEEATKPIEPLTAQDQRLTSYHIPADRWPALFEASTADYFDDAMAAWRELSHRRRLAREQAGSLWSE